MQERQVTIGDKTYPLPQPFIVMATQNPIEQEGTYPLPEAQIDRFMLKVKVYIVEVVFATREPDKHGLKDLAPLIEFGASPRASIALNLAARAHAFLKHRGYVTPEDVKAVGPDGLRHRLVLTYEADAEEVTSEQVVKRVFEVVEVP